MLVARERGLLTSYPLCCFLVPSSTLPLSLPCSLPSPPQNTSLCVCPSLSFAPYFSPIIPLPAPSLHTISITLAQLAPSMIKPTRLNPEIECKTQSRHMAKGVSLRTSLLAPMPPAHILRCVNAHVVPHSIASMLTCLYAVCRGSQYDVCCGPQCWSPGVRDGFTHKDYTTGVGVTRCCPWRDKLVPDCGYCSDQSYYSCTQIVGCEFSCPSILSCFVTIGLSDPQSKSRMFLVVFYLFAPTV